MLFIVLSNGTKPAPKVCRFVRLNALRLMPLVKSALRKEPKNHVLSFTIGPPSETSTCFTDWTVGSPPGNWPQLVLSLFHARAW